MTSSQSWRSIVAATATAIAACSAPAPLPLTSPHDAAGAAVVRTPVPERASPPAGATAFPPPGSPPLPRIDVPPRAQYVCVTEIDAERRLTAIEFTPQVARLCERHPEMGPCQYERNLCRRSGGRVYATGGVEITMDTEADYDRKVMRVRFKAN